MVLHNSMHRYPGTNRYLIIIRSLRTKAKQDEDISTLQRYLLKRQPLQFGDLLKQLGLGAPDLGVHGHHRRPILLLRRQFRFLQTKSSDQLAFRTRSKKTRIGLRRRNYMKGGLNVGIDGGVEAGKGIVPGEIPAVSTLFVDVVLLVFLADRINAGQYIDHAHISPLCLPPPELLFLFPMSLASLTPRRATNALRKGGGGEKRAVLQTRGEKRRRRHS